MASALIGALRVTLGMDSAKFEKGANRSIKKMDAVSKAGFRTGRALRGLAGIAATAAVSLAAIFSTRAIKDALDYAASLGEVSAAVGVTVEELQIYRQLGTQVNVTQEVMEKSLAKLTLSLGKAALGSKIEKDALAGLNIELKNTNGSVRATGDVMLDLADRISKIPDPARKSAAAYALFGRAGQKLIPLLDLGAEGIEEFGKQAKESGSIISTDLSNAADRASDKMALLNEQFKSRFSILVAQNAGAILSFANALGIAVVEISKFISKYGVLVTTLGGAAIGGRFGGVPGALAGGALGLFGGNALGKAAADANTDLDFRIEQLNKSRAQLEKVRQLGKFGPRDERRKIFDERVAEVKRQAALTQSAVAETKRARAALEQQGEIFNPAEFLDTTAGGGKGAKAVKDEIGAIREQIVGLGKDIEESFDSRNLPKSLETAEGLREKLADIGEDAAKAGVPVSTFAAEIATLQARIKELEIEGLTKEAQEFAAQVDETARVVKELTIDAMTPLERRIAEVDDRYDRLRASIQEQIDENKILADVNEDAARTMAELIALLGKLDIAHRKAAAAATAQFQAEQALRDLSAQQARQELGSDIADLERARGDTGPFTANQRELQEIERDLQADRIDALIELRNSEAALDEAKRNGDTAEAARLSGIIELQRQYADLVDDTTAEQIVAANRLQTAFESFTSGLADALTSMVTNFDFSLKSLGNLFRQLISDIFVRPAMEAAAEAIGNLIKNLLKSAFAGGFATGGVIPSGQWGIVGENGPEAIFAGDKNLRVFPNGDLGGGGGNTTIINQKITTPDPNAFRASMRQISRQAKRALS